MGLPSVPSIVHTCNRALSIYLRTSPTINGITRTELKLSLYADDLLLYVTNLVGACPTIVSFFNRFGRFSGYKVNVGKTDCYPVKKLAMQLSQLDTPFKLSHWGFRYLGVNIARSFKCLYYETFSPLLTEIKTDFLRWGSLPLSLIGRINTVKMPKLVCLFQCLPIFLPEKFLF